MKKSELYKIVKEALNEVLQEQRVQRLLKPNPDRKPRDRRDPRDPKDPIRPMMDGTSFFSAYTTDCKEVQIDDAWVCGGTNNTSLQPNEETGIIVLTNYTNMPSSDYTEDNIPSSGCANVSELTLEEFASWLSTTTVFDGMSTSAILNGLGIFPASDDNIEGCVGCNVQYANDGLQGDQIEATNYSSSLLDSALADVSYCIYPGCTESDAINFNSNANTDDGTCYYDQGGEDPGCIQTWSSNYSEDAEVENGTCASYIVGGCTDDDYVEGQSVTDENGQVSYPNQSQEVQTAMAEAQTIVDAYNAQYEGSATVNIVAADVVDQNLASNYYCTTDAVPGCTDNDPDTNGGIATNYTSAANVDDGSCEYGTGETIYGCMDQDACNYNPLATIQAIGPNQPGDPCVIPTEPCDECETDENGVNTGNIINTDTDGDGICDAQEIPGCTNSTALNYNPDATDDDGSCKFEVKCKNIKAIVCNAPQVRGQKKVGYAPISLACVTIDGQTPNMELPATSQFKYPLPSNIVDPAGNTVSSLKRTLAIWQVTSITTATGYSADQVTDLPFGNCKGPVQVIGDRDPRPLDPSPKEPYFSNPTNPFGDPTSTGYDRVNDPDVEDSKKLREAFEFEFKLTEEQKLKKLIKDTLKQLKK